MSKIKKYFIAGAENIEEYIRNTKDFTEEIGAFKELIAQPEFDRALFVFYVEVLSRGMKKPVDFNAFVSALLPFVDEKISMKTSILFLRAIRSIHSTPFFVPISFYLTKLMGMAVSMKNVKKAGRTFNYDSIKLTADEANSEELQFFVIRECIVHIKKHCRAFGSNIGFPEFAAVVCNELKARCKVGVYKEITVDVINYIQKRKSYVEEQRNKLGVDARDSEKVRKFEKELEAWVAE